MPPQHHQDAGLGEFGRPANAAMDRVDLAVQTLGDAVEQGRFDGLAGGGLRELAQRFAQGGGVARDLVRPFGMGIGNGL